jgi:hypothetical protein
MRNCHYKLLQSLEDLPRAHCPTPHKIKHYSLWGAEMAAENQWLRDKRLVQPYRCVDHFHLTSQGCTR